MSYDPLYPGGRFWSGPGGVITIIVAIACICMPLLYISMSLQQNASQCIGCESDARDVGQNMVDVIGFVVLSDLVFFILYLMYLWCESEKKKYG